MTTDALRTREHYGRSCLCCAHPDADALDVALGAGASIADLSRRFAVSGDSISRHRRFHLRPQLAAAVKASPEMRPAALVERIASIANDARDARRAAYASGNAWLGARLGESEMRALVVLADRFEISHDDAAADLADAASVARALTGIATTSPELGSAIADALDAADRDDLADALRATMARARTLPILETTPARLEP